MFLFPWLCHPYINQLKIYVEEILCGYPSLKNLQRVEVEAWMNQQKLKSDLFDCLIDHSRTFKKTSFERSDIVPRGPFESIPMCGWGLKRTNETVAGLVWDCPRVPSQHRKTLKPYYCSIKTYPNKLKIKLTFSKLKKPKF